MNSSTDVVKASMTGRHTVTAHYYYPPSGFGVIHFDSLSRDPEHFGEKAASASFFITGITFSVNIVWSVGLWF